MAWKLRSRPSLNVLAAPYRVSLSYGWWSSRVGNSVARPYTEADDAATTLRTPASAAASTTS